MKRREFIALLGRGAGVRPPALANQVIEGSQVL
jgi:hypothetical protein